MHTCCEVNQNVSVSIGIYVYVMGILMHKFVHARREGVSQNKVFDARNAQVTCNGEQQQGVW